LSIVGRERKRDIDFDVIREPWNRYSIREGTTLQVRFILLRLRKVERLNLDGSVVTSNVQETKYDIQGQTLNVLSNIPEKLKGTPDMNTYTPQELQNAIVADDLGVDTIAEEWNDYVADDGAKIRVKCSVISVSRTSKYDKDGEPIYIVSSSQQVAVKPKKP
jgi:hypothetical protein